MNLDNTIQVFTDELRDRASTKRRVSIEAAEKRRQAARIARRERIAATNNALSSIRDSLAVLSELTSSQLAEILAILKEPRLDKEVPVSFTVTERDGNGKIKSFKIDSEWT